MKTLNDALLTGYDSSTLLNYSELADSGEELVPYRQLPETEVPGVLKANFYKDKELIQLYSHTDSHVLAIAGTRLGKTSSYVIPTVLSFANQKSKKSMVITDPKGEIYKRTAAALRKKGYTVKLINFRDSLHSECWNILTPIYRKLHNIQRIYDEVELVIEDNIPRNKFRGKVYTSQAELDHDLNNLKYILEEDVANDIYNVSFMVIGVSDANDPYWDNCARELVCAALWAMLEDSLDPKCKNPTTEDNFSFSTMLTIMGNDNYLYYFTSRDKNSRSYQLAKNCIIENAENTRKCIISVFNSHMAMFRESATRVITSCNSFEISELAEGPIALFIDFRDELKTQYKMISLLLQDAYRCLIEKANRNDSGKLDVPFYFILDEFGNCPKIRDFDTTISACAGRNIFFILIVQSYAQLNNVYGKDTAEIIRDNLNVHVFLGSNNPDTLEQFSKECGQKVRISPLSAYNGKGMELENYNIESIPLVAKSRLSHFEAGECIVTEANCPYVLFSKLERYYMCPEYNAEELCREDEYVSPVNSFDMKYIYVNKNIKKY